MMRSLLILTLLAALPFAAGARPPNFDGAREMTDIPSAATFTSASLRNRIRVELNAPVSEVWALMGDLGRFPEYSVGLERVEVEKDGNGTLKGYVCHFKPQEERGESVVHREIMRWYEPDRGYASTAEEPNPLGQTNSLALMTLEATERGTRMTYVMHYDAVELDMTKTGIDQALADIGENLIRRFGGRIVERYVRE